MGQWGPENGLTQEDVNYLMARGLASAPLLARCAIDEEFLQRKLVTPFIEGVKVKEVDFKTGDDELLVRARLATAWQAARDSLVPAAAAAAAQSVQAPPAAQTAPRT